MGEEVFRIAFDSAATGMALLGFEGQAFQVNRALCRMFGYTAGELTAVPFSSFTHPRDVEADVALAAQLARGDIDGYRLSQRYVRKDGTVIHASSSLSLARNAEGKPICRVAQIEDVTERRAADEALRQSEAQYRELIEHASDGIFVVDLEGACSSVNRAACRMLGYTRNELLGRSFRDLTDAADWPRIAAARAAHEPPSSLSLMEGTMVCKDGSRLPVEVSAVVHPDGRWQGFVRDVRARKAAEQERKQLEVAFDMRDRMAMVSTLAAGVGHEINNPLSCVIMNLDLMAEEILEIGAATPSERVRSLAQMMGEAREGADRVRKIVRGLHTFSCGEREERAVISLRSVLDLSIGLAFNELRHRTEVVRDFREVPPVRADEARLAQVFINLLANAAQALEGRPPEQNLIRVSSYEDGHGRAVIEIADNGPGMPEAVAQRVFEPFFTTKAAGSGTGLGLSIAHKVVTGLGGTIVCESKVGVGTTFRILLPGTESPESSASPDHPPDSQRGRVLVVDPDPSVGATVKRVLAREHDVTLATSADEALELLANGLIFDAILCEIAMPKMSGMEFFERVQREHPAVLGRVSFFTGGTLPPAVRAFLRDFPHECLDKPFHAAGVRALVRRILAP